MRVSDLTDIQLERIYEKLWKKLPQGDCFGFDWNTLWVLDPPLYKALRSIHNELVRREPDPHS